MADRNEKFGRLVRGAISCTAGLEGKNTAEIDEELAGEIGLSTAAIHRFKKGMLPNMPSNDLNDWDEETDRAIKVVAASLGHKKDTEPPAKTSSERADFVKILAKMGAQRARLSRTWGEQLLLAAKYPYPERLLDEFWPSESSQRARPSRVYHNLPAPTYNQFVMRTIPYKAVLEGLRQRTAVVLVISMGGMGKTSLAREVAGRCLVATDDLPQFEAAVWISDKDHPGTTTLETVLNEIAHTLDYPGLTRLDPQPKRREVEQLLKGQRVLLVLDNFETITDDTLLHWLLRLPEPSKALVTTREYRRAFQQGAWLIEMTGMTEIEARQLISERSRQLGFKDTLSDETAHQLITAIGGNPKAIEMLLGLVKRTHQKVIQVIASIPTNSDDLFAELFNLSWARLTLDAQCVVMALTLFSASATDAVLAEVSGLTDEAFVRVVEQLADLSLIETQQAIDNDAQPIRRTLHPLTRKFAASQLATNPTFAAAAQQRLLAWAIKYSQQFGFLFTDITHLNQIDNDEPTLAATLNWAFQNGHYNAVIQIAKGMEFYYYVQVFWNKKLALHELYIEAARRLGNVEEEINALTMHIQLLCRQGNHELADSLLPRLRLLDQQHPPQGELFFQVHHAYGLYHLATEDFGAATKAWTTILAHKEAANLPDHMIMGTQQWLATSLYHQGEHTQARRHYEAALAAARNRGYKRMIARNQIHLARMDNDSGQFDAARERLEESEKLTDANDREQRARISQELARLHARIGEPQIAAQLLRASIDLFKQMGLTDETAVAQAELTALEIEGG